MLRPGTDIKLLHAKSRRLCEVCASKLQLAGMPMVFEGEPDEEVFDCFGCGAVYGESRLRVVS